MRYLHTTTASINRTYSAACTDMSKAHGINVELSGTADEDVGLN